MSGGVDSSVAARRWSSAATTSSVCRCSSTISSGGDRTFGSCCTLDDLHDARRVAAAIKIPHYILNLERQFDEQVVSNFVREYASGRTPLPCAHCNSDLKFATLVNRARGFGADLVATGHYARVNRDDDDRPIPLTRGADPSKDQSYFLFSLTQDQLARAVFPVGDLPKAEVREYARRHGLSVADKPDSHEICFVPDNDYAAFVESGRLTPRIMATSSTNSGRSSATTGEFTASPSASARDSDCRLADRGADVRAGARARPITGDRRSRIGARTDGGHRLGRELDRRAPSGDLRVTAQIRHRHRAAPATMRRLEDARAEVTFDTPQLAVTPGQAVVLYDGDVVVGGGWID